MRNRFFVRLTTLALALCLLVSGAQALTAQEAVELLEKYYIDDLPAAVYGHDTAEGVLSTLGDPYTEYFDAAAYQAFLDSMRDQVLVGIGVVCEAHSQGVLLSQVMADSPAEEAGLRAGDVITAVDGRSAAGEALETVGAWLRGEEGTTVTVTFLRDGQAETITMTRRAVTVPATSASLLDGHIGWFECTTFGEETLGHFEDGVAEYDDAADRWVVDLRSNGGGDVNASVQTAGTFAGAGYLAYLRDGEGRYGVYVREEPASTLDPVVVLTGPYTASASEIFASIIRDRREGLVVGERTYGKGVAQILLDGENEPGYFSDGDGMKITAYRYFSYQGTATDSIGVIPHLLVSGENTPAVAWLLCASNPAGDTAGLLRLDLGWRWYIDLDAALSEPYRAAFTELLEAIPPSAALWRGTGGVDGWEAVTPETLSAEYGLDYTSRGFSDTESSDYALAIDTLATYGLVDGVGEERFAPASGLTRAQLCALVVKAMRYEDDGAVLPFSDVAEGAWYTPYLRAAYAAGLIEGYADGTFRPDAPVSRQELITVLGRLAAQLSMNLYQAAQSGPEGGDWGEAVSGFDDWARPWAWLLSESQTNLLGGGVNLLWAAPEDIAPQETAAREEAAALLYSILSYTGILPV